MPSGKPTDGHMENSIVATSFKESIEAKQSFLSDENTARLIESSELVVEAFNAGAKLLVAGNGGSASDAQHLAAEFVNRFEIERPPLPALALTTDTSILTSIGNDYSFDEIFSKQIKALGRPGDVFIALSTSGRSSNILRAVEAAQSIGMKTIALTGKSGSELAAAAEIALSVESETTARIQEVHITVCHILCQLVDHALFERAGKVIR